MNLVAMQNVIVTVAQPVRSDEFPAGDEALTQIRREPGQIRGRKVIADLTEDNQVECVPRKVIGKSAFDNGYVRVLFAT